jgi:heme exporter protein B
MNELGGAFLRLVARDIGLALREGSALGTALGFYAIVIAVMPLGLGPDLALLSRIAPGVLWIALLLAALLSLGRLFDADAEDGSLEAIAMGPLPLELVVMAKALAHWLTTGLPLVLLTPVLALMLNLDLAAYKPLLATLLAGTPAVSFIGAIGAGLTLRARRGGLLVALLVLPLFVPTLIYGIAAVEGAGLTGGNFWSPFLILSALSVGAVALAPFAAAVALRVHLGS